MLYENVSMLSWILGLVSKEIISGGQKFGGTIISTIWPFFNTLFLSLLLSNVFSSCAKY
jgi:hypothetical protein